MRWYYKFLIKFYDTWLGSLVLRFQEWLDSFKENTATINYYEVGKIIREQSKMSIAEGVKLVKIEVNKLVNCKTKEEYDRVLLNIENLIDLANNNDERAMKLKEALYKICVKKGGRDITSAKQMREVIKQRIQDYKELQEHTLKRQLLRKLRKADKEGNTELLTELKKEWTERYGQNTNIRRT